MPVQKLELPKTIAEALKIDTETGTTYWKEAKEEELSLVAVIEFKGRRRLRRSL